MNKLPICSIPRDQAATMREDGFCENRVAGVRKQEGNKKRKQEGKEIRPQRGV